MGCLLWAVLFVELACGLLFLVLYPIICMVLPESFSLPWAVCSTCALADIAAFGLWGFRYALRPGWRRNCRIFLKPGGLCARPLLPHISTEQQTSNRPGETALTPHSHGAVPICQPRRSICQPRRNPVASHGADHGRQTSRQAAGKPMENHSLTNPRLL